MDKQIQTWHIHIKGIVQGVGYRPLVYAQAKKFGLSGYVKNGMDGLHIEVNCNEALSKTFAYDIGFKFCPAHAKVVSIKRYSVDFNPYQNFTIKQEEVNSAETTLSIAPDFALCKICRKEMSNPKNRRFNYEFITCTNCGPRYSIFNSLPYDRINTEMHNFKMCQSCESEYQNPEDRRYYSQTNSCLDCGIRLSLFNAKKECITQDHELIHNTVINAWRNNKIVAIKGIGGYLLTCDASNTSAINHIRLWKKRPSKPLALMYPGINSLQEFDLKPEEINILESSSSPITLIAKNKAFQFNAVCDHFDRVGVMIPYNPLFQILLNNFKQPIVATSGNISKSPIIFKDQIAIDNLSQVADYVVSNDRTIITPQDDSVVVFSSEKKQKIIIRRSRGMAPNYINKDFKLSS